MIRQSARMRSASHLNDHPAKKGNSYSYQRAFDNPLAREIATFKIHDRARTQKPVLHAPFFFGKSITTSIEQLAAPGLAAGVAARSQPPFSGGLRCGVPKPSEPRESLKIRRCFSYCLAFIVNWSGAGCATIPPTVHVCAHEPITPDAAVPLRWKEPVESV